MVKHLDYMYTEAHYALFIKKFKVKGLRSIIALKIKILAIGSVFQTEI